MDLKPAELTIHKESNAVTIMNLETKESIPIQFTDFSAIPLVDGETGRPMKLGDKIIEMLKDYSDYKGLQICGYWER